MEIIRLTIKLKCHWAIRDVVHSAFSVLSPACFGLIHRKVPTGMMEHAVPE